MHVQGGEGGGGNGGPGGLPLCPDDLGDAPDSFGTLRASGGAFHTQNPINAVRLGLTVDTEPDGQPSPHAWGDLNPDEDGLVGSDVHAGGASSITVRTTGVALLQAWIDFNQNGIWGPGEQVATNMGLGTGITVIPITVPAGAVLGPTYMRMRYSTNIGVMSGGAATDGEVEDHAVRICPPTPDCCRRVAFVVDLSDSMNRGPKAQQARNLVTGIITGLPMPMSGAAIVTFNKEIGGVLVPAPMQQNKPNLLNVAAVLNPVPFTATFLAPGIDAGQTELGNEQPLCDNIMIIITDGKPNDSSASITAANAAKAAGTRILVLGLGLGAPPGVPALWLAGLASSSNDYYDIPDPFTEGAAVAAILSAIACEPFECPPLPGPGWESFPDLGDAPDSSNHFGLSMTAYDDIIPNVMGHFPSVSDSLLSAPIGPKHVQAGGDIVLGQGVSHEFDADYMPDEDNVPNLMVMGDDPDNDGYDDGLLFPLDLPTCGSSTFTYTATVTSNLQPRFVNAWFDFNRDGDWADTLACNDQERGLITVQEWTVHDHVVQLAPGTYELQSPVFNVSNTPLAEGASQMWVRISVAEAASPLPADGRGPLLGYQLGETEDYRVGENAAGGFEPYPED
jgi:hypothetical protein